MPAIKNVVEDQLASSTNDWYTLIDKSIRAKAKFLLPLSVFKKIDLTYPVFINDLNGFYIIEEIEQYVSGEQEVVINLIKLPDEF